MKPFRVIHLIATDLLFLQIEFLQNSSGFDLFRIFFSFITKHSFLVPAKHLSTPACLISFTRFSLKIKHILSYEIIFLSLLHFSTKRRYFVLS